MRPFQSAILLATGVVPVLVSLLKGDTNLLIYSVFVGVYLLNSLRGPRSTRQTGSTRILLAVTASGFVAETFAWPSNYVADAQNPALLSPQLGVDLFLAVGYYGGWALAWMVVLRRYCFPLWQAFVVTGLMGVFVEQNGGAALQILQNSLASPGLSALSALYVFTVYGSIAGTAHQFAGFDGAPGRRGEWLRYPLVVALMFLASSAFTVVLSLLGGAAGIVHHPLPIREHPFF